MVTVKCSLRGVTDRNPYREAATINRLHGQFEHLANGQGLPLPHKHDAHSPASSIVARAGGKLMLPTGHLRIERTKTVLTVSVLEEIDRRLAG